MESVIVNDHRDKNSAAINNRYLHVVQTRGLILSVNNNHVDNKLKEILEYVYLGWLHCKQSTQQGDNNFQSAVLSSTHNLCF